MDTMDVNKSVAAFLVVGIVYFLSGTAGTLLVAEKRPEKTHMAVDMSKVEAPKAAAAAPKPTVPIADLLAKADPAKGEAYAKKVCAACHSFTDGGKAGVGPNLYNVVGGPHAHMQGYSYSDALKAKTGPWTYEELNEWLTKPAAYAQGTKMGFAGISNDEDRADVIDYLHTLSPHPEPLPQPGAPAK
jgi:cytochrome c